ALPRRPVPARPLPVVPLAGRLIPGGRQSGRAGDRRRLIRPGPWSIPVLRMSPIDLRMRPVLSLAIACLTRGVAPGEPERGSPGRRRPGGGEGRWCAPRQPVTPRESQMTVAETVVPLRTAPRVDQPRAERAVAELLAALGYPVEGEHRAKTPQRVASALAEMLTPTTFLPTTFPNDEGYDELVVARQVPFRSLCEHHLLPFYGFAHVGYLPGHRIVGLPKLARVVRIVGVEKLGGVGGHFGGGLEVQERLTQQVADWLYGHLDARGVGVVVEAEHLCMSLRGVRARGSRTVTSALRGDLRTDARTR